MIIVLISPSIQSDDLKDLIFSASTYHLFVNAECFHVQSQFLFCLYIHRCRQNENECKSLLMLFGCLCKSRKRRLQERRNVGDERRDGANGRCDAQLEEDKKTIFEFMTKRSTSVNCRRSCCSLVFSTVLISTNKKAATERCTRKIYFHFVGLNNGTKQMKCESSIKIYSCLSKSLHF